VSAVILASALVGIGLYGVLTRRDLVAILIAIEVMLGGATLLLVHLVARYGGDGEAAGLIVLVVAAAEAAVGLGLLVVLARRGRTRTSDITEVRG
jgi:NADH-quinone oxidoreductase subunit K